MISAAMSAGNYVFSAITWTRKIISVCSSAKDIRDTVKDENIAVRKKCARVGANLMFIAAQSAELGVAKSDKTGIEFHSVEISNEALTLGTSAAAGVTDVVREIVSQKGSTRGERRANILEVVAYRVADVGRCSLAVNPHLACNYQKEIQCVINAASATETLVAKRDIIYKACLSSGGLGRWLIECVNERRIIRTGNPLMESSQNSQEETQQVRVQPRRQEEIQNDAEWNLDFEEELDRLRECESIPPSMRSFFGKYICPITGDPIRFVYSLKEPPQKNRIVYYEKSAILKWIGEKSDELPPGWNGRTTTPLTESSVEPNRFIQETIDDLLSEILKGLSQNKEELINNAKLV